MIELRHLTLVLLVAACTTPSLPLLYADMAEVEIDGLTYRVRHDGQRAEAVRVSPVRSPSRIDMLTSAQAAIETVTGCEVRDGTLYGDRVMAEALLSCPGTAPARVQSPIIVTPG